MFHSQSLLGLVIVWPLVLCFAHAQSNFKSQSKNYITTSLVLANWDAQLSVIEAGATATTYLQNNHNPSRNSSNTIACNVEAFDRMTVVAGPSTAAATVIYTECGTNQAGSLAVNCPLTATDTATCTVVGAFGNATTTVQSTMNSSEASPQPCTIVAGIEKLSARTLTATTSYGLFPSSPKIKVLGISNNPSGSTQVLPTTAPPTTGPTSPSPASPTSAGFEDGVSFHKMLIAVAVISLCVLAGL